MTFLTSSCDVCKGPRSYAGLRHEANCPLRDERECPVHPGEHIWLCRACELNSDLERGK